MRSLPLAALAAVLAAVPAAAEEKRHAGAHEHGHGTLNIAVEGNRVSMELKAPGMDIAGFEHAATSEGDKEALAKAEILLKAPLEQFKIPPAAGCKAAEIHVELGAPGDDDEDHGAAEDGGGHEHSAFTADYVLECENASAITSIEFAYFKSFERAEELEVGLVTDKTQASFEVTRDKPVLDLSGSM